MEQRTLFNYSNDKRNTMIQTPCVGENAVNPKLNNNEVSIVLRDEAEEILLYRCLKTACHEICHVLGMTHCPYFECLMNGSNLVTEADKKPFALCPICLRKLDSYCEITNTSTLPH